MNATVFYTSTYFFYFSVVFYFYYASFAMKKRLVKLRDSF